MTISKMRSLFGILLLTLAVTACDSSVDSGSAEDNSEDKVDEVDTPKAWHEDIYGKYEWENPYWLSLDWFVRDEPYPGNIEGQYVRKWFLSSVTITVIQGYGVNIFHELKSRVYEYGAPSQQVQIQTTKTESFQYFFTKPVDAMPEWVLEVTPDGATFQFSSRTQLIYTWKRFILRPTKQN